eukprot:CAMPEP_0202913630 /NCGR_PEP_ID=MMETSP1392-20130828/60973_1 /ASSEMBLY_ACC=CAM_ASM_000868 /TAXON_ID=225041 /ORGANISM="Chlamydomonas chlamydogama, Strain SAG 11-48b" /LENGTH=170 /DNA_ID=CAMNT_0049604949 /DNA_START=167 /DNA_END=679 /DNA_ORIENTATION=-
MALVVMVSGSRSMWRGELHADGPTLLGWLGQALLLMATPPPRLEACAALLGGLRAASFLMIGRAGGPLLPSCCLVYLRFNMDVLYEGLWYPITESSSLGAALLLRLLLVPGFTALYSAVQSPAPLLRACLVHGLGLVVAVGWEVHHRANYLNHLGQLLSNQRSCGKPKAE